ncbi:MAG: glycosyltransferase family 4 protein, partial [Candidatus Omnitrophica bacterium]|nr:glycosyltransferase family 4 protein [Candidatus Omnitrophota bacterium]MBU1925000.1 glycosyltransferase family 4 protein [Candidatus Omnitrophota bacterium]
MISERKIRVAQVVTRMDWGGSADLVRILCEHLDKTRYEVTLVCGVNKNLTKKTRQFLENFKPNIITVNSLQRDINPLRDLWAFFKLLFVFKKEKFDIVHTHTAKAGMLGRMAACFSGVKTIVHTAHGHNFYGYFGRVLSGLIVFLERVAARVTNKIIALTQLEKSDFIAFNVAPQDKIDVIDTVAEDIAAGSISTEECRVRKKRFGVNPEHILVGFVGRLEPIKGVEYFIEAGKGISRKFENVKFIVVGEGSLKNKLQKQTEVDNLRNRFIFTGWSEDVAEIMDALDILVLPSLNEAVGIVLLEAQAKGVAVIATRVGGIPEVVKENETAILVPPQNVAAITQALEELIKDKDKRQKM